MENKQQPTNPPTQELTRAQKKAIAKKMLAKTTKNKVDNNKYFDFYDDIKDRTRGHEDW